MKRHLRKLSIVPAAMIALGLCAAAPAQAAKPQQLPFEAAKIIIELNSTDQDVGIQVFLDGEAWKSVAIIDPNGRRLADVTAKGTLKKLGLTELFFESEEPSLADLPLDEFLALFPEGEYTFLGKSVEGDNLFATATFTHQIPDGPTIVSPGAAPVDPAHTVIDWNPVTTPAGIQIAGYEVIIEQDAFHVLDVKVPAAVTSLTIPPEFLAPGTEYKFEVLAIEVGGNQTITEGTFTTQ
jgi:fibronectin type III domain protein